MPFCGTIVDNISLTIDSSLWFKDPVSLYDDKILQLGIEKKHFYFEEDYTFINMSLELS